ncbi:hypothetical protein G4V62_18350 [Bacillaceae bacterium SIJ1]|nr:hypothetical protein [Litoribacterium kuwaitense]
MQRVAQETVELFQKQLAVYRLGVDMEVHFIRGLRSAVYGFLHLERWQAFGYPISTEKSFQLMIDTWLAGVHKLAEG